jgi:hypothetical protein
MTTDEHRLVESEIDDLDVPDEDEELPCDFCNTLWPSDALAGGLCPDCIEDGRDEN